MKRKVIELNDYLHHYVMELYCLKCGYRGVSTYRSNLMMMDLQCPRCGKVGHMIATGDPNIYAEFGYDGEDDDYDE